MCSPLVDPKFSTAPARRATERDKFGLACDELAILISSGSWGVGAVKEAFELIAKQPGLVPVVTCGHNAALRQHLEEAAKTEGYRALAGWTDDMAGVMAASDVLVENAVGSRPWRPCGARLPLVTFRPIPGHGRNSAAAMSASGVSSLAHNGVELLAKVELLGRRGPVRHAAAGPRRLIFSRGTRPPRSPKWQPGGHLRSLACAPSHALPGLYLPLLWREHFRG